MLFSTLSLLLTPSPTSSMINPRWIMMMPLRFQVSLKRIACAANRLISSSSPSVYPPGRMIRHPSSAVGSATRVTNVRSGTVTHVL